MRFTCLIQIICKYLCGCDMCNETLLVPERLWSLISYFLPDLGWFRAGPFLFEVLCVCVCVCFSLLQDLLGCHKTQLWSWVSVNNSDREFLLKNLFWFPTDYGIKSKCLALKPFYDLTPICLCSQISPASPCVPHSVQPNETTGHSGNAFAHSE